MLRQAQHERFWLAVVALLASLATPAAAQERDLCTDRPGLGTPPCTVQPGRVVVETALADWTLDRGGGARTDTILLGDTVARIGVGERLELQVGWTPFGHVRERVGAAVAKASGVGDVTLGAKLNFASPDGGGFSLAVQPQVTLPVGRAPIGAGDWGFSLILPVSYDLSDTVQLQASPELNATVDADGDGRHTAFGGTVGLGFALCDTVGAALEAQAIRDRDPAGHATEAYAGVSLAWRTSKNVQFDIGANAGLNRASDDVELYAGVSARF